MLKLSLFLSSVFFLHTVSAVNGELYYQPQSGQNMLQPSGTYNRTNVRTVNGTAHFISAGLLVDYLYGMSEDISFGGSLNYRKMTNVSNSNYTISGLGNINLFFRGKYNLLQGTIRYGANLGISPEPAKSDADGHDSNLFTGQNDLRPYLAFEMPATESLYMGVSISRLILLGKQVFEDSDGVKTKTSGGEDTEIGIYSELHEANNTYGAFLSYSIAEDRKDESGSTSEKVNMLNLSLYSRYELANNIFLVPRIQYGRATNTTINSIELYRWENLAINLGGRFVF